VARIYIEDQLCHVVQELRLLFNTIEDICISTLKTKNK